MLLSRGPTNRLKEFRLYHFNIHMQKKELLKFFFIKNHVEVFQANNQMKISKATQSLL